MIDFNPIAHIKEVGGVVKLGSGVLGKSSIVVVIPLVAILVGICRLHSDGYILGAIGLVMVTFFLWFFGVLMFARTNPDTALLEGAEWTGYQRFQASAKGFVPQQSDRQPTALPGSELSVPSLRHSSTTMIPVDKHEGPRP